MTNDVFWTKAVKRINKEKKAIIKKLGHLASQSDALALDHRDN